MNEPCGLKGVCQHRLYSILKVSMSECPGIVILLKFCKLKKYDTVTLNEEEIALEGQHTCGIAATQPIS